MNHPMIAPIDLHTDYLALKPEIDNAVQRVLDSGWYILGQEVAAFEREFATYLEGEARGAPLTPSPALPFLSLIHI